MEDDEGIQDEDLSHLSPLDAPGDLSQGFLLLKLPSILIPFAISLFSPSMTPVIRVCFYAQCVQFKFFFITKKLIFLDAYQKMKRIMKNMRK